MGGFPEGPSGGDDRLVRLKRIPMEILLFLIECRAEVVTRERIAERI